MKLFLRRIYLSTKSKIDTLNLSDEEYKSIQHRPGVLEYINPRLMIMSTLVYLVPILQRELTRRGIKAENAKVLDAGARDGWTVALFQQLGFTSAEGVELVDELVEHAQQQGRKVTQGDVQKLDGIDANKFDLIFCRHTLEHTMDPALALRQLVRVCVPEGLIYVSLPLEREAHGKHTTAIPNLRLLKKLAGGEAVDIVELRRSSSTGYIIPDADEALMILRKKV